MRLKSLFSLATAAALCLAAAPSFAQAHDTLIVPYLAGGQADTTARRMSPLLTKYLDNQVIVENIPGASGMIGMQRMLRAGEDGRTFVYGTSSELVLTPFTVSGITYTPEDLRLIAYTTRAPFTLVGGNHLEQKDLKALVEERRKPGAKPLTYGSIGIGSLLHAVGEAFSDQAKVPMLHVPYKGVANVFNDLMGGQIDLAFVPTSGSLKNYIDSGRLHIYGIAAKERSPLFPDLPTMEQAISLTGFHYDIWGGIVVPAKVSDADAQRLNTAFGKMLENPEYRAQQEALGATVPAKQTLEEAQKFYENEIEIYRGLAKLLEEKPKNPS